MSVNPRAQLEAARPAPTIDDRLKADYPKSADNTDIPERSYENAFEEGTWLHDLFEEVLGDDRDVIAIIDDRLGRRGTGKTVKSLKFANAWDQTDRGVTFSKCSLQPEEIRNSYANQPPRSGLVLDEAEFGASNRDAMSNVNKALREIMSMGRVEQKYVVINAPIKGFIDTDIQKLCDVWISVYRKGLALVHQLEWEPYSETLLTKKKQWLKFDDIDAGTELRDTYNKLTKEKRKHIDGGEGEKFVPQEEHQEILEREREQARQELRNELIQGVYDHPESEVSQRVIGEAVGLEQATISTIVNS